MSPILSPRCTTTLLALCLGACSAPDGLQRAANGDAVRAALAAQVAYPQALRNADPVKGIDGSAALQAQQKYEKSFSRQGPGADAGTSMLQSR